MVKQGGSRQAATAVAAAALALMAHSAQAAVANLDFEAAEARLYFSGEAVVDSGFQLSVLNEFGAVDTAAGCFIAVCPTGNDTQFFQGFNDGHVALTYGNHQTFQLLGFDAGFIAPFPLPDTAAGSIQLRAITEAGDTVYKSFQFAPSGAEGSFAFKTYGSGTAPLSGLGWLRSVEFFACTWDEDGACSNPNQNLGQFALDNIHLQPIPEPSTIALMALGIAGLIARSRRPAR
jgi:hypothetical protein